MNITVSQYLINFRIKKACEFLSSTGYSITSISYLTGFNNPYNFSKRFSAHKNMSPKEYRHQHKTEPEQ
jgi:transcriptional regulator GlxA family with amidase domain